MSIFLCVFDESFVIAADCVAIGIQFASNLIEGKAFTPQLSNDPLLAVQFVVLLLGLGALWSPERFAFCFHPRQCFFSALRNEGAFDLGT
jgi:hypothetical protein